MAEINLGDVRQLHLYIYHDSNPLLFQGVRYINDQITDNIWNTVWFYQVPVPRTPVLRRNAEKTEKSWHDALDLYLQLHPEGLETTTNPIDPERQLET